MTEGVDERGRPQTLPSWRALIAFGLATRVVVVVAGCFLAYRDSPPDPRGDEGSVTAAEDRDLRDRSDPELVNGSGRWIEAWYRFDAIWYAETSRRGYVFKPGEQCTAGFMPLLPLLMAGAPNVGLHRYWVGLIAPNLAFAIGLALFGRLAARVTGDSRTAWRACLLLAQLPQ
jgi:hypothetical protein